MKLNKIVNDTAKFMKQTRKESGITQTELANKTGISQSAICKYEYGMKMPVSHFLKIVNAFGIQVILVKE